jgi:hypothetical protein
VNIVMVIAGVLRSRIGSAPIPAGVGLYRAFVEPHRVMLISDHHTDDEQWLRGEGLTGHVLLQPIEMLDALTGGYLRTARKLRALGPVDLVISDDPGALGDLLGNGFTISPLLTPAYARPQWRPDWDGDVRSWDSMLTEVELQRRHKANQLPVEDPE